jgi:hypothetical protein
VNEMIIRGATALAGTDLRKLSSNDRRNMLISARAVLRAAAEPTEAMIAAAGRYNTIRAAEVWRVMHAAMMTEKQP